MIITFYSLFEKRANSTKLPATADVHEDLECLLLDNTSIVSPIVKIEKTDSRVYPYTFTYAYITTFDRYYHVTNVVSEKNFWIIFLSVDVLATYRHEIRNSRQYVLRSSVVWDQDIVDGVYPTIAKDSISLGNGSYANAYDYSELEPLQSGDYQIYRKAGMISGAQWSVDRTYFKKGINSGGFIVGIVSDNGTGNTYYAMSRPDLVTFMNKILTLSPTDFTDTSTGVARSLLNAIQYITSITWFPAIPTIPGGVTPETSIKIAGYPVPVDGLGIYNISSNYIEEFYFKLDLPNHPKRNTDAYGILAWLNLSPYTQYNLYFAPFGNIPLDTTKLMYSSTIRVEWSIDFMTGNSILKLKRGDYDSQIFYTTTTTLGVSLPVSSLTVKNLTALGVIAGYEALSRQQETPLVSGVVDWFNSTDFGSHLSERFSAMGKDLTGMMEWLGFKQTSPEHDVGKAIQTGVDAITSALGQVHTKGTPDSFLAYYEMPILYAWFLDIAEPDKERFGRPLNQIKTLSSLTGGYVKCADSNVTFGTNTHLPTLPERNQVNRMLNTGVFLE